MSDTSQKNRIVENKEEFEELKAKLKTAANYCFNCNRCVNVCPLSHLGIFSPRDLINDLNFLSIEEALKNNNIWSCLTCGECTIYCPMTKDKVGVNIPNLVQELRKIAAENELEFEKLAQCETHDGMFPLISKIQAESPIPPDKLDFLKDTSLKTTQSGKIAYFVGCLPILEDVIYNFDINYVNTAKSIIGLLNEGGIKPVVLNEKCCGHDILLSKADEVTFQKLAEYNVNLYKNAGVDTIIFSCAEGYKTWKYDYPKYVENFDFKIYHFTEYFLKEGILDNLRFPQELDLTVTYHDACRLGRMGGGIYDPPRDLIKKIPGVKLIEMEHIKEDAKCCGVSGFSGCNEYTRLLRNNRIREAESTGADYMLVSCPKCLSHFKCFQSEPNSAKNRTDSYKKIIIKDLASFIGELLFLV